MIEIMPETSGKILAVKASGILSHKDYKKFLPMLDAAIAEHGNICIFVDITEFEGFTPQAMIDDFMAGIKYWWNVKAAAIVGDAEWEKYLTKFADLLTRTEIEYFNEKAEKEAWDWLKTQCAEA